MFENAINNIDKALRNDEGMATELDYKRYGNAPEYLGASRKSLHQRIARG